ncbi:MAG: SOS response-associated peptidase [Solirubrobacterales bacterium]
MCGRYTLTDPNPLRVAGRFGLEAAEVPEVDGRYNVAPTDTVLAIRDRPDAGRGAGMLRWGLVPHFSDGPGGKPLINARAETAHERPAFRGPFERRRCLVVADGFYEWQQREDGKQPLWIHREDGDLFAFAGIWDYWRPDGADEGIVSCAVLTCVPNELMADVHDRMPVILDPQTESLWLEHDTPPEVLRDLVQPRPWPTLGLREVSTAVNDVRNDGPRLLDAPGSEAQQRLL